MVIKENDSFEKLGLSYEDSAYLEKIINNLNIKVQTVYEGLTEELIMETLDLNSEEVFDVLNSIRKLRIYRGYDPQIMKFGDGGLFLEEKTIKSEDEFVRTLEKIDGTREKVLDIERISEEEASKLIGLIKEKRTIIYEDVTPRFLDEHLAKGKISLTGIFDLFKKMSIIKGYKVDDIMLSRRGMIILQEPINTDEEYWELIKENKIELI